MCGRKSQIPLKIKTWAGLKDSGCSQTYGEHIGHNATSPPFQLFSPLSGKGRIVTEIQMWRRVFCFPLRRAASLRKFRTGVFSCSFEAIFSSFIGHDRQLDSLHTLMTLSHWRVKECRARFISGCRTDANSTVFFVSCLFRVPDSKCIKEAAARLLFPPFMTRTHKHAGFVLFQQNHRALW